LRQRYDAIDEIDFLDRQVFKSSSRRDVCTCAGTVISALEEFTVLCNARGDNYSDKYSSSVTDCRMAAMSDTRQSSTQTYSDGVVETAVLGLRGRETVF